MSNKLAELRQRLAAEQEKSKSFNNKSSDKANYRFWDIPDDEHSVVRFLPNGADQQDGFFWVEKLMIKLPFAGIRGKNTNQVVLQVPCMQMYGENCPIQDEIKPLWKTDEDTARIYYKKKSFILHGFVRKNAIKDDETNPENPIRRFNVNGKLMKIIQAGLMDPDMEDMPTDFTNGTDFYIYKTKQGQWADYSTSKWARKSTSLTESEALALEANPLADLSTYLPKKPDEQTLAVIMEMFVDSMNGDAYDLEKYGKFYKPFGLDDDGAGKATAGSGTHTTVSSKSDPVEEVEDDVPFDGGTKVATPVTVSKPVTTATAGTDAKMSVQDLLKQLKDKQAKK